MQIYILHPTILKGVQDITFFMIVRYDGSDVETLAGDHSFPSFETMTERLEVKGQDWAAKVIWLLRTLL